MREEFGGELVLVGVTQADADGARGFASDLGTNYPLLANGSANFDSFGVSAIPQVYLVNPDGSIVAEDLDAAEAILRKELGG